MALSGLCVADRNNFHIGPVRCRYSSESSIRGAQRRRCMDTVMRNRLKLLTPERKQRSARQVELESNSLPRKRVEALAVCPSAGDPGPVGTDGPRATDSESTNGFAGSVQHFRTEITGGRVDVHKELISLQAKRSGHNGSASGVRVGGNEPVDPQPRHPQDTGGTLPVPHHRVLLAVALVTAGVVEA